MKSIALLAPLFVSALFVLVAPGLAQTQEFRRLRAGLPEADGYASFSIPYSGVAGDFDGDGIDDLVLDGTPAGYSGFFNTHLLRGEAGGLFASSWEPAVNSGLHQAIAVDIESDGDLDLVWKNLVHLNDGTGAFTYDPGRISASIWTDTAHFADIDGDGDQDLVRGGPSAELLINDGTGFFFDESSRLGPSLNAREFAWCDVDDDDDLDLIHRTGLTAPESFSILLNDGAGTFAPSTESFGPLEELEESIQVSDLDLDGDQDLLVVTDSIDVFANDGEGAFTLAASLGPWVVGDLILMDVDGDGLDDLMVDGLSGWELYRNQGALVFTPDPTPLPPVFYGGDLIPMDVGDDGDLDLIIIGRRVRLWLNDGTGAFLDVTDMTPRTASYTWLGVGLGDLDGDQDLDLFISGSGAASFENDGTGQYRELASVPGGFSGHQVLLLDADGDDDLDALMWDSSPFRFELAENDGAGIFTATTGRFPFVPATWNARSGDVNGDGFEDIVVLTYGDEIQLFLGDGSGSFSDGTSQVPVFDAVSRDFAIGDVDGDGDLDLIVLNELNTRDLLLENDGTGTFTNQGAIFPRPAAEKPRGIVLFDMDDDGDLDAALASRSTIYFDESFLFRNDGSGNFVDVSANWPVTTSLMRFGLTAADVEGDGDLDLIAESRGLWLNDGAGVFVDASDTIEVAADGHGPAAVGDVDLDGDLDFVVRDNGKVLLNTLSQLVWRDLPRIGAPLTFDLYGAANRDYLLFGSVERGYTMTQAGVVRLDLTRLIRLGSGRTDASGRAYKTFPIPSDPGLIGMEFFTQGLWLAPLAVTNLERTTMTGY